MNWHWDNENVVRLEKSMAPPPLVPVTESRVKELSVTKIFCEIFVK
jgi:uncharacterized UBP type Zn finger protein